MFYKGSCWIVLSTLLSARHVFSIESQARKRKAVVKPLFGLLFVLMFSQAQAGFVSCVVETGEVITGAIDGELNVDNFQLLDVVANEVIPLKVEYIGTVNGFELVVSGVRDGEPFVQQIKADKINVLSKATYGDYQVQAPLISPAVCMVKFAAGI
jgi:hypothetical protein